MFCDKTFKSCIECRETVEDYGAFKISSIEGCPDRNSFSCDNGSCQTECYSFEDGQSIYLCDDAMEYCRNGRCVLKNWDWTDFAPMSLSGLGEMRQDGVAYTVAISQLVPITIKAYGMGDYVTPPELIVEGQADVFGEGKWFTIGTISVYGRKTVEAEESEYQLISPVKRQQMRIRLVTPPSDNYNMAATGLPESEKFIYVTSNPRKASGSRYTLGYSAGIPYGLDKNDNVYAPYLKTGGAPAVIITEVKYSNNSIMNNISSNTICPYEGVVDTAIDGEGRSRKIFYGDILQEQSNQAREYCKTHSCIATPGLMEMKEKTGRAWGLLNCNYANHEVEPEEVASITLDIGESNRALPYPVTDGLMQETANGCKFEQTIGGKPSYSGCYEWIGSDVSMDIINSERQPFHTLDFDVFKGYGYQADRLLSKDN
jgi:hypothetical protein